MAPIALGSPINRYTQLKKVQQEVLDGFGTRAIHVGSDPDPNTGAVIPAISLSTTYKQDGVGIHKVCLFSFALLFGRRELTNLISLDAIGLRVFPV